MWHLGYLVVLYLACVLEAGAIGGLTRNGPQPSFVLLAVILACLTLRGRAAIVWAAVAGLLRDLISAGPMGIDVFLFVWLAWSWQQWVVREKSPSALTVTLATFASAFLWGFASTSLRLMLTGHASDHHALMWRVLSLAVTTTAVVAGWAVFRGLGGRVLNVTTAATTR